MLCVSLLNISVDAVCFNFLKKDVVSRLKVSCLTHKVCWDATLKDMMSCFHRTWNVMIHKCPSLNWLKSQYVHTSSFPAFTTYCNVGIVRLWLSFVIWIHELFIKLLYLTPVSHVSALSDIIHSFFVCFFIWLQHSAIWKSSSIAHNFPLRFTILAYSDRSFRPTIDLQFSASCKFQLAECTCAIAEMLHISAIFFGCFGWFMLMRCC